MASMSLSRLDDLSLLTDHGLCCLFPWAPVCLRYSWLLRSSGVLYGYCLWRLSRSPFRAIFFFRVPNRPTDVVVDAECTMAVFLPGPERPIVFLSVMNLLVVHTERKNTWRNTTMCNHPIGIRRSSRFLLLALGEKHQVCDDFIQARGSHRKGRGLSCGSSACQMLLKRSTGTSAMCKNPRCGARLGHIRPLAEDAFAEHSDPLIIDCSSTSSRVVASVLALRFKIMEHSLVFIR